jgi:predicted Fe-Mo cluster-binding NifX family protein
MKIALTSQNRKTITGHTGKCRKFWIYEVDGQQVASKTLLELSIKETFHESHGAGPYPLDGVDVLISGGMGQGLTRRLAGMHIKAVVTPETDLDKAVAAFQNGSLALGQAEAHDGDHHHHGHDHGAGNHQHRVR